MATAPEPDAATAGSAAAVPKVVQFAYKNFHSDGKQRNCHDRVLWSEGRHSVTVFFLLNVNYLIVMVTGIIYST